MMIMRRGTRIIQDLLYSRGAALAMIIDALVITHYIINYSCRRLLHDVNLAHKHKHKHKYIYMCIYLLILIFFMCVKKLSTANLHYEYNLVYISLNRYFNVLHLYTTP